MREYYPGDRVRVAINSGGWPTTNLLDKTSESIVLLLKEYQSNKWITLLVSDKIIGSFDILEYYINSWDLDKSCLGKQAMDVPSKSIIGFAKRTCSVCQEHRS